MEETETHEELERGGGVACRSCIQMRVMNNNPSARCYYHMEKFTW